MLSRPWRMEEDELLVKWVDRFRKMGMSRSETFEYIAEQLNRSAKACNERWNILRRSTHHYSGKKNDSSQKSRWKYMEEKLEANSQEIRQLIQENRRMREEMRFFEKMLLEEYQLLIRLLEQKQPKGRIHRL
ncbi:Myb-like DNA-binding domain-containing protein [Melghirimyces algeriensis]|uniref:Myb-like DNA-binding domain-containing protein n=1 Tax=Melghirimyces algeriensis TaxID=910412 RepID=A0A521CJU6_9BACL|nr:Myb-like DNA-binding domain-containing protein [Melghirimyces algeriensis]